MTIRKKIFYAMLAIFTFMYVLSTWWYYHHFENTLLNTLSNEALQINRYVLGDLSRMSRSHKERMELFDLDADVALLYDENSFTRSLGIKLVEKKIRHLFNLYPYMEEVIFYQNAKPLLTVRRPVESQLRSGNETAAPRTREEHALHFPLAEVVVTSNPVKLIQAHIKKNKIDPSTRFYYEKKRNSFLVGPQEYIQKQINLSTDKMSELSIDDIKYLTSPLSGQEDILLSSLLSLDRTGQALQSILNRAFLSFCVLLILAFAVAFLLAKGITQPLNNLELAAIDIIRGNFSQIPLDKNDEIRPVLEAFNTMSRKIQGFTDELQRQVDQRTAELKAANSKLARLNETDSLTQLKNRQFLTNRAPELLSLAMRNNLTMGIAMMDIDHFKSINDHYGHAIGDQCLMHLSHLAMSNFQRDSDYLIRYGGEEFCLIGLGKDRESFYERLELFREFISKSPLTGDGHSDIFMTISIGAIHQIPQQNDSIEHLIDQADQLLYRAKRNGRNQCVY